MREIKFRAWHEVDKKWLHGYSVCGEGCYINGEVIMMGDWLSECHDLMDRNNVVIEQFTGLYDKNRGEIYEGDIVRCWNGNKTFVGYNNGAWCVGKAARIVSFYEWEHDMQVIGNIHENPELLRNK